MTEHISQTTFKQKKIWDIFHWWNISKYYNNKRPYYYLKFFYVTIYFQISIVIYCQNFYFKNNQFQWIMVWYQQITNLDEINSQRQSSNLFRVQKKKQNRFQNKADESQRARNLQYDYKRYSIVATQLMLNTTNQVGVVFTWERRHANEAKRLKLAAYEKYSKPRFLNTRFIHKITKMNIFIIITNLRTPKT